MRVKHRGFERRRGVILLIVMAMLALFASVGLTFVFYAESEADISRTARSAESQFRADVEPELLLNHFLSQAIYDTADEYSALRGHSLARTLYSEDPLKTGRNGVPFNGAGVPKYPHSFGNITNEDNAYLINFTNYSRFNTPPNPADQFVRDPGYYGIRTPGNAKDPTTFRGGDNAPWTYPDRNSLFLAAVDASGAVLKQSYYRDWISGDLSDPANPHLTSPAGKYRMLRPRPVDHNGFPRAENRGGDVRNLPFGPGVKIGGGFFPNDSFWMYTGFPVMTAASGKKYTVLFAPLMIDLDGRLNLSMTGNLHNPTGPAHLSHQGFGRWEINPQHVGINATEFVQLLSRRYGGDLPEYTFTFNPLYIPAYSKYDWDGDGGPWALPVPGTFSVFPSYPPNWDSGLANEWTRHGAKYSYFNPQGNDQKRLHASHMDALLNGKGKGSPALTSDLFKNLPTAMSNEKIRNLVTLLSYDFNRPGLVPFTHTGILPYKWNATKAYPEILPGTFPDPANPTPGGEFDNLNSKLAALKPLNLNRKLLDYVDVGGPLDGNGDIPNDVSIVTRERQDLAREIYNRLVLITGAKDPNTNAGMIDTSDEYIAARWLAQLAVNLVDYLDPDDVMTPFIWNTTAPTEILFGTELPRLVINEAYVHMDNDPADPGLGAVPDMTSTANYYRLMAWVELHNPFPPTPATDRYPLEGGHARLKSTQPIYRVVLSKPDPNLRAPNNPIGRLDDAKVHRTLTDPTGAEKCIVDTWADGSVVEAVPDANRFEGPAGSNKGFFLVGPNEGPNFYLAGRAPGFPASSFGTKKLVTKVNVGEPAAAPTIILQRLACPYRPFNDNPADPLYNPYITVDFVDNVKTNQLASYNPGFQIAPPALTLGNSVGRRQPYAASVLVDQNPTPPPGASPKHTFFKQNALENMAPVNFGTPGQTLDPADWLVHLDRQMMNPMELLNVSSFRPHELTRQFVVGTTKFAHLAPWEKTETLLYRFLEMVHKPDFMMGAPQFGRTPGKININTVWDVETFRALLDANGSVSFTQAEVDAMWVKLLKSRTPTGIPGGNDKPFYPLSMGYLAPGGTNPYTFETGLTTSLMREDPDDATQRLFALNGANHPFKRWEPLSKMMLNTTTRSNVFAVWVTAGFFEVTDDSVNPPRIGREIGKDDNRHIRHKFFAIVDRTAVQARITFRSDPTAERRVRLANTITVPPGVESVDATVTDTETGRTNLEYRLLSGDKFTVTTGTYLTINPDGANEETVQVTSIGADGKSFNFKATKSHQQGEEIIFRCWTGPWPTYDVRRDEKVVPYFTVID